MNVGTDVTTSAQPPKKEIDLAIAAVRHIVAGMSEEEAVQITVDGNPGATAGEVEGALAKYWHFAKLYVTL